MNEHFKLIVLGGGSAGYAAARTALTYTNSVAVVDGSDPLGGLCILRGCMPSKTLIYSAEILHLAQRGKTFGLNIPEAEVDIKALHERKNQIVEEFAAYRESQLNSGKFKLFRNHGKFIDPHTLKLDNGDVLSADYFVITTGSLVDVPEINGLNETPFWTSDDILELNHVPESIIVLGGGIVACELAQFLNRIGSKIIQIQRSPHVLKEGSPEAAAVLDKAFRDERIELFTGTAIERVKEEKGNLFVRFTHNGKSIEKKAKRLFNALGRIPNTKDLGLKNAGVELLDSGHVKCDAFQQSSAKHIYAAGDCAGPHEIVHIAILQGECAATHALKGELARPVHYHDLVKIVFTDPQIATAGLSEKDLQKQNIEYISANYPFDDHGKSILMDAKYGYVKVLADRKEGKILGAECVGKDASELIHSLAVGISLNAKASDLLQTHWYHPTLSEIWSYPLESIVEQLN